MRLFIKQVAVDLFDYYGMFSPKAKQNICATRLLAKSMKTSNFATGGANDAQFNVKSMSQLVIGTIELLKLMYGVEARALQ